MYIIILLIVHIFVDGERIKIALYRQDLVNKHFEWINGALKWTSKLTFIVSLSLVFSKGRRHISNYLKFHIMLNLLKTDVHVYGY